jgi:hypothetical protein
MAARHLNGITPRIFTATTVIGGVATFTIPAGVFTRYDGSTATPVGVVSSTGLLTCQVTTEPAVGTNLSSAAGTVTVQVARSKSTGVLVLNTMVQGLEAAPAGITVRLLAWGV